MPRLFSREAGSGRALIFLHGFCDTHEVWTDFVSPYVSRYRVITPDLPGFGSSAGLSLPFTIDQAARAVANWMDEKKISRPVIVGHSMGGYIALSLLEQEPDRLEALVLFHSTARADLPERKEVRNKVIEFVKKNGVQPYIDTYVPGLFFDKSNSHAQEVHARASRTRPEILTGYAEAMRDRPDRSLLLSNMNIRTLFIGGVEDTLIPIQSLRDQAKMAQNARLFELEKVGHMGFFEAKLNCQGIITRFTEEVFSNK